MPLEVEAGDEVGQGAPETARGDVAQNLLVGAHEADLGVVKGREETVEEARAPKGRVINANGDGRRRLVKAVAGAQNLTAFVGLVELDNDDVGVGKAGGEPLGAQHALNVLLELDTDGRDDEALGAIDQDGLAAAQKGSRVRRHRGHDNGDIAVGVSGRLAKGVTKGLVEEVTGDEVDNATQVAKQEEDEEDVVRPSELGNKATRHGEEEQRRGLIDHGREEERVKQAGQREEEMIYSL